MIIVRPPNGVPPTTFSSSLFLAGPSPRTAGVPDWRQEALTILAELGWDGVVFVPLPETITDTVNYDNQVEWEQKMMGMSDMIVFWIPRDLEKLPGFTTNVEFGMWMKSGKVVLGFPPKAPKMRYLETLGGWEGMPVFNTLADTLFNAVYSVGLGAERIGGEREVPLQIWNLPAFQGWLTAQKKAGNRLDGAKTIMTFRPNKKRLFLFALHVDVFVESENRSKNNEIVIFRPDISTIVAWSKPVSGMSVLDIKVVIVKEFRSPASVGDCFIREVPGGSSIKTGEEPTVVAAHELEEETGLAIDANRLVPIGSRQVAGTLAAHRAHAYAVELDSGEMDALAADMSVHGVEEDTERTFVEVRTVRELLQEPLTDWANLGMIFAAVRGFAH
jgi:ADP-ribose pyrophosphatase YjhB (NUDIX family)